jgi:hypothetical protein
MWSAIPGPGLLVGVEEAAKASKFYGQKIYNTCVYVDISYAAPQAHGIVNVELHQKYSPGIVFIFSQGRKDLYHV